MKNVKNRIMRGITVAVLALSAQMAFATVFYLNMSLRNYVVGFDVHQTVATVDNYQEGDAETVILEQREEIVTPNNYILLEDFQYGDQTYNQTNGQYGRLNRVKYTELWIGEA